MSRFFLLLKFFKDSTLSLSFVLRTWIFALLFLGLSMVLINVLNFISIGTSNYSIPAKLKIFWALFAGSFQTVSQTDIITLFVISILFGINLALVLEKYSFLLKSPNLKITIGTGLISLVAAGCASCGLSVASLIGLGAALAILPFGGIELYIAAIIILLASFYYNLSSLYKMCKI